MASHAAEVNVLRQGVECILGQSFADFEFMIIDDVNGDEVSAYLGSLPARDPRVVVLKNERNQGLTRSLVLGIAASRGHYIARQDVDDVSRPARLEMQVQRLEQDEDLALLGTWFTLRSADGSTEPVRPPDDSAALQKAMFTSNPFCHASVMFRRSAYERAGGYDTRFRTSQDFDLWLRIARIGRIGMLERDLVIRHSGVNSLSRGRGALRQVANGLRIRWRERDQYPGRWGGAVIAAATGYHLLMTCLPPAVVRGLRRVRGSCRRWLVRT
jgi:GT2 family glycosyltransferase